VQFLGCAQSPHQAMFPAGMKWQIDVVDCQASSKAFEKNSMPSDFDNRAMSPL
jgi:hypothetical protein